MIRVTKRNVIVIRAIELFVEWMNRLAKDQGADPDLRIADCLPMSSVILHKKYELNTGAGMYILSVGNGDDGGPATLHVYTDETPGFTPYIRYILHEFDGYIMPIFTSTPHELFLKLHRENKSGPTSVVPWFLPTLSEEKGGKHVRATH